jgi:DNA-binding CsgD family transcriptional regulator
MDPKLLDQRKEALQCNEALSSHLFDICHFLKLHPDLFFVRATFFLDDLNKCEKVKFLTTDQKFAKLYLFNFDDNGRYFTQAIQETSFEKPSYFIWPEGNDCPLIQMHRQQCSILKGMSIYKREGQKVNVWGFHCKILHGIPSVVSENTISPFLNFISLFEKQMERNNILNDVPLVNYSSPFDMSYKKPYFQTNSPEKFTFWTQNQEITFSKRELECLSLIAQGKPMKLVAYELGIGQRTVETHVNNMLRKIDASSKSVLIELFWRNKNIISSF